MQVASPEGPGHLGWGTGQPVLRVHGNVKQLNHGGSWGGNSLSYNCFFMNALSLRHGGVRMLFTCEEKEIYYPVGLVIFMGEGEKSPMTGVGSLKWPVPER